MHKVFCETRQLKIDACNLNNQTKEEIDFNLNKIKNTKIKYRLSLIQK
jgi:hypothetical protein